MDMFAERYLALLVICFASALLIVPSESFPLQKSSLLKGSRLRVRNTPFGIREESKLAMANAEEKLIYDEKANRFFEAEIDGVTGPDEFFLVDTDNGKPILLTKEEKERIFLDSVQSYYFSGSCSLSDEQFDKLKEDLTWEGSDKISLNRNETTFLNALMAYNKGSPIMKDAEFDALKKTLKEQNSPIAVATKPQCYVDTGVCKVTWEKDNLRTSSLYIPASLILGILYIGVLYEIPFIRTAFNPLVVLVVGSFPISIVAKAITESFFFKDPFVAKGACPSCETENKIFFGDVFGVEGPKEEAISKCTACKSKLTIKRSTLRVSTLQK